jgi:hypothetical protein
VRGAVIRMDGPHRVSGGWWARTVERDYFYAETSAGDIAWVYHDGRAGGGSCTAAGLTDG